MSVPESAEVIDQNAAALMAIYQRTSKRGGGRHRRDFLSVLNWLAHNPERALRISLVLGDRVCTPMRPQFNLEDPVAGIFLSRVDEEEPDDSAMFVGEFLNHVLRGETDDAVAVFEDLALTGAEEIEDFLGLLVAMTSI